jgi:hypothetical protein
VARLGHCATSQKVVGSIPSGVIGIYNYGHCGPGVNSASNRNEYGGYLLGVKVENAVWLDYLEILGASTC